VERRFQTRFMGRSICSGASRCQDFYIVATKTITRIHKLPLVFNAGLKRRMRRCSVWQEMLQAITAVSGFGAAGLAFKGPGRSTILGSEVIREPRSIQGLPSAVMPTHSRMPFGLCRPEHSSRFRKAAAPSLLPEMFMQHEALHSKDEQRVLRPTPRGTNVEEGRPGSSARSGNRGGRKD
jgi:hypothetical protein